MLPKALALVPTVLTLMALAFFVLSSTPLLVLKHDVPMDSRVIRQVFHYCFRIVAVVAGAATAGFVLAGRPSLALCLGSVAVLALALHHWLLTRMDALRGAMHAGDRHAVWRFRRLHLAGIALNLGQLAALTFGLTQLNL